MSNYTNYVSLDLETTGLDDSSCDIIEVAMIKVRDGVISDSFESFVYTPLIISQHVSYLTGISAKDIEQAPDLIDLVPQIEAFIGDDPILGHNISFDWNFLIAKGVNVQENALWDTYLMSNILYPDLPSHSLETNTKYFGISHADSHRAMADVMACYELWKILLKSCPEISSQQRNAIEKLKEKSNWPLLGFFLEERDHESSLLEFHSLPEEQSISLTPRESGGLIHAPGSESVDIALSLKTSGKTLYTSGYEHSLKKLEEALPEAIRLRPYYSYLSPKKKDKVWQKEELEVPEAIILLKTILYPDRVIQEDLVLTHPERPFWNNFKTDHDEMELEGNPYFQIIQQALESDQVIISHAQLLHDLHLIDHFESLVILEPQFLEGNATRVFGKTLFLEQWREQAKDENWIRKGDEFFEVLDKMSKVFATSSPYKQHIILSDVIIQTGDFIRLRSLIRELSDHISDDGLSSYLKYYHAFFNIGDPSWVRWISVDPRRGVSLTVAPLSVDILLKKHLFDKLETTVISDTSKSFGVLPELERYDIPSSYSINVSIPLDDMQWNTDDHETLIGYLADHLPRLEGKTGVVFSSKTALKRYFFDLVKVMPDTVTILGEDLSGGTGKIRDRYLLADQDKKIIFLTYRNMRSFARETLDFDNIVLQSIPFDPPGFPVHQARSEQYSHPFDEYTIPKTQQNLLEIISKFSTKKGIRNLTLIDKRFRDKPYGKNILEVLEDVGVHL